MIVHGFRGGCARSVASWTIVAVLVGMSGHVARADAAGPAAPASDAARADQLFQQGKQRLAEEDYAAACPLLAESNALDPATGSLLALAFCHERQGKLASAFREYMQVAARSEQERRPDREAAAREKASQLEPRLSTLTIAAQDTPRGLEVRLDGELVDPELLGRPLPVDGGNHLVSASAPSKQAWSAQVEMAKTADSKAVYVSTLEDAADQTAEPPPAAPLAPASAARAAAGDRRADASGRLNAGEWIGITVIGAGVVALGVGTSFLLMHSDPAAPHRFADRAALAWVIGGSMVASGTLIYLVSRPASTPAAVAARPWTATAWAAPHAGGAALRGAF
jgi:hypothetical protein